MQERRDPGAAGERTFLAWHRSGLTTFVVAAVLLRAGEWVAAVTTILVGTMLEVVAVRRLRALHAAVTSLPPPLSSSTMRFVAASVLLVAVGAALSL